MMGMGHAATGAAVWLAVAGAAGPGLHLIHAAPAVLVVGTLITAGAALAPDWDHPQATVAHSFPGGRAVARTVSALAGGHRRAAHALLVAALLYPVLLVAGLFRPVVFVLVAGSVVLALKALRICRRWGWAWAGGLAVTVAMTVLYPGIHAYAPVCIAAGYLTHLLGDMLTAGGVPALWPYMPDPPDSVS